MRESLVTNLRMIFLVRLRKLFHSNMVVIMTPWPEMKMRMNTLKV